MCGIAGIFAYSREANQVDAAELRDICEAMRPRGPDGDGIWTAQHGRAGLAHRRLAIIDLSETGAQPMPDGQRQLWITFNGEIYNFRELRAGLEARGLKFRSNSDTEVLLGLYREYGTEMVRRLRGMFAFAIWDESQRSLFLARDGFGIKPLYYSDTGGTFRFASQVKALLAGGAVNDAPDPAGHAGFFLWGAVPEPYTTYRAVRSLPAGCWMLVTPAGAGSPVRHFSVQDELLRAEGAARPMSMHAVQDLVSQALSDTVKHHLVADVPVGLFLSAGIDSCTIAAAAVESAGTRLRSVTLGFREYVGTAKDETVLARRVANAIGLEHETRWIEQRDFGEHAAAILASMDQPSTDGVNTWFVSRAAAQTGLKVALSGLGGDEIFAGYPSFRDVPRIERFPAIGVRFPRLSRWARGVIARASVGISPKYAGLPELAGCTSGAYLLRRGLYLPWELRRLMDAGMAEEGLAELATLPSLEDNVRGLRNPRLRVTALELCWYMRNQLLRDTDWAGMAHSLEVRVPLVDTEFLRAVAPALACSNAPDKIVLGRAARMPLPAEIAARPKTGFTVPVSTWFHQGSKRRTRHLRGWARRVNHAPGVGYRVVGFFTDAFGGRGGIALASRDYLSAIAHHPRCREVVALPRLMPEAPGAMPNRLTYRTAAAAGKARYIVECVRLMLDGCGIDAIVCGHINLLPVAVLAKWVSGAPILLATHGIEAWRPPSSPLAAAALRCVDEFFSVSEVTRSRFLSWAPVKTKGSVLPNAIHLDWYSPGPKDPALMARYGLASRATVLMTLGRLSAKERYKGFDEVLEALPGLRLERPELVYLIVGEGSDRARLEAKAIALGLQDIVKFTGYVSDAEKASHYRLADAFVMPSRGEGFGFVLLEALACGAPAMGSSLDGSREALRGGLLGKIVDPRNPADVRQGIVETVAAGRGRVPEALSFFSYPRFEERCHRILDAMLGATPGQGLM